MTRLHVPLLLSLGLLGGCVAAIPNELLSARIAYASAAQGRAAALVPAEVHKAQEALEAAEVSFRDDPKGYHTKDLAYVAQRKAQLAEALAARAVEMQSTDASNAQYQVAQDAIMRDTREQLGASKADLAASQRDAEQSARDLTVSEAARASAEGRAAAAQKALAELALVQEEARGLVVTLSGSVLFLSGESTLMPAALVRLGQVSDALMETKERGMVIEGHTDSQGSDAFNLDLGQRRAEAVRTFLVSRGHDPAKVRAAGIGEARPIGDNGTPEGRANNRRVEIVVAPVASR